MATLYLSPITAIVQYFTNLGLIAAGGSVTIYQGGTVNTPAVTYTDSTGVVANANPLTLNSAARPASASAAPVAFWTLPGVTLKLLVSDAAGNLLVGPIDNIASINDPTNVANSLTALLASAASSNPSGIGPVAGVDLVANAVKSYDVFADVRSANAPVLATGGTLDIVTQGALAVGDNLGGVFYWSPTSTTNDDGANVLKPNSVGTSAAGRYLRQWDLGVPRLITKPTDQQLASSTALITDSALLLPMGVGTWLVQMRLVLLGTSGTGQGYKIQPIFTGSGATTGPAAGAGVASANGVAAAVYATLAAATAQASISSTTGDAFNIDMIITVTTAGVFGVQWAQNSSSGNATVMKAGSALLATRIA